MKLGPMTIHVEVSRDPCSCGAAPSKATVPVKVSFTPAGFLDYTLRLDVGRVERDATAALACKRCEL